MKILREPGPAFSKFGHNLMNIVEMGHHYRHHKVHGEELTNQVLKVVSPHVELGGHGI